MNKKNILIIILVFIILVIFIGLLIVANFKATPYVVDIEISESKKFNNQMIMNIYVDNYFFKLNKSTWCLASLEDNLPDKNDANWVHAKDGYCSMILPDGDYFIFLKDSYGNIVNANKQNIKINKVLEIRTNKDTIYMWKGRSETLTYELVKLGDVNPEIKWSSDNENVAKVDQNGKVTGISYGTTYVNISNEDGVKHSVKVIVSSYITKPVIDTKKSYIGCKQFNNTDADMLDQILFDRVNDAGYGTRAGVLAATRFLTLEFSYRIHYFSENGRLNNYAPYKHVDGEGRYYHRGLYLNENKFKDISASFVGPAIWGCKLQTFTQLPQYTYGNYYPNGLDCSGFVTWALLNGGFDVGDIGAGENELHNDLDDLGTKVKITEELMSSGKVKAGDLIGLNGHMAILAGWDDNNYYIAESLNTTGGVVMTVVPKNKLVNNSIYKYIILMDSVYKKDGNYTQMW